MLREGSKQLIATSLSLQFYRHISGDTLPVAFATVSYLRERKQVLRGRRDRWIDWKKAGVKGPEKEIFVCWCDYVCY